MESIVIQTISEHFGVNVRAAGTRMFKFFNDQRGSSFAHDKPIAQQIERTASESGIPRPSAHGFDDVERAHSNSRQRRFRSAGDNHIRKIIPDVSQRFAHRYGSTGATIRVCRAYAAKTEFDRDIRMGRTTKYL